MTETPRKRIVPKKKVAVPSRSEEETQVVGKGEPYGEGEETTPEEDQEDEQTETGNDEDKAEQSQFPSLRGLTAVEIEKRGADNDGSEDGRWRKTFVLLGDLESLEDPENEVHRKNEIDTLQQAIMNGLHPQEEATFDGAELHEDGVSVNLHYSVNVVPSIVDHDPESAVTPTKAQAA